MKMTRRDALKMGLAGTGALLPPLGLPDSAQAAEADCRDPLPKSPSIQPLSPLPLIDAAKFKAPLAPLSVLPALPPSRDRPSSIDYYEITMQKARLGFLFDQDEKPLAFAEFWTYNGIVPGPLIRQKTFRQSCIRFTNLLGKDAENREICTSVHLHGMASLPQYDGYAEDLTLNNQYKDYYYPNSRASILWYHDHAVKKTSRNAYMGLAGMYIVQYDAKDFCQPEAASLLLDGKYEIPLILQDKIFEIPDPKKPKEWKLVFNDRKQSGVYADVVLVNGRAYPTLKVERRKYFFRILNASASRTYQLTLSREAHRLTLDQDPLIVVGSDAGLLKQPEPLIAPNQFLRVGVAERYGFVIDFAQFPEDVSQVYLWDMVFTSNFNAPSQALMQFELTGDKIPTPDLPAKLGKVTLKEELLRIRQEQLVAKNRPVTASDRSFRFGRSQQWTINNHTWNPEFVEAKPGLFDVEIWELVNTGGWVHPVHIHLIDFQILDRNGQPPLPYEQGWKDVVLLKEFEKVRVIASFNPQPGKYMMHCHNLVHEDHDMMAQFEVLARPGDRPAQDPVSAAPPRFLPALPLGSETPPEYPKNLPSYGDLKNSCSK